MTAEVHLEQLRLSRCLRLNQSVRLLVIMANFILPLFFMACGNEYVCPDPIGKIVRDDCQTYQTRYESLKVQLGFSFGGMGVTASAGQEKLRDPSELLQLLLHQSLALCKDFNACRVMPEEYRHRRDVIDQKFTAITAISQQLKAELDNDTKRQLVTKLVEILTNTGNNSTGPLNNPTGKQPSRTRPRVSRAFFRNTTSLWFNSPFAAPMPKLPPGVPAIAQWEISVSQGIGDVTSYVHLVLRGKAEVDDRLTIALTDPPLQATESVKPVSGEPQARVSFRLEKVRLNGEGTMTLTYYLGATGKKQVLGTIPLSAGYWLNKGYVTYQPDPVRADPVDYERLWIIFYTASVKGDRPRVTLRCQHNGRPISSVLMGEREHHTYSPIPLDRHHIPLPIRLPLRGGNTRGTWHASFPGEELPQDLFPREAAGDWSCQASLNGRPIRRLEFHLRPDGSLKPGREKTDGEKNELYAPPWWPIKTTVLDR